LRQVKGNKGSAGVDRMTVDQLGDYLKENWLAIREQLLNGTCEPKPVRRVEIPKPGGGGVRKLGIPIGRCNRVSGLRDQGRTPPIFQANFARMSGFLPNLCDPICARRPWEAKLRELASE